LAFGANFISSWIRIRIWNADPDPGDKFNADPDMDPDPKHWLKVVWLEIAKTGEELLSVFNFLQLLPLFNNCKQKLIAS
jgi:hypothetical protein